MAYINCPTRWSPNGLTPTHHQSGGVSGTGGEHTKMVPAHIVLRRKRREERGVDGRVNIMMDLTVLYPIATEHAAKEEALGGKLNCAVTVRF